MSTGDNGTRLVLDKFTVARGDRDVVRDVSIEIPQGEVTALLGPNGAGKSSLVLGVAGVLRPSHGSSIKLDGRSSRGSAPSGFAAPVWPWCPRGGASSPI